MAARDLENAQSFVVVDERGAVFPELRTLDLGVGVWRVLRTPSPLELAPGTVVVIVVYDTPAWDVIRACASQYLTIVAAVEARDGDRLTAIRSGAFGYVDVQMPREGLRRTLRGVVRGEAAFARDVIGSLIRDGRATRLRLAPSRQLTNRQREILTLLATGATSREAATTLGIRPTTARRHVSGLLRRLSVTNSAAAVSTLFMEKVSPVLADPGKPRQ